MKEFNKDRTRERNTIGPRACIWSEAGAVSVRTCIRELECRSCLFDQNMADYFVDALERMPAVPQAA